MKRLLVALTLAIYRYRGVGSIADGLFGTKRKSLSNPSSRTLSTETGIPVEVRYGDTAELAATILEEGRNSARPTCFWRRTRARSGRSLKPVSLPSCRT